jgi:SAM-dependent methyltransferase
MKPVEKCDLCGGKEFIFRFNGRDRMHEIPGEFIITECKNCGLMFLNPRPSFEELEKYYPSAEYDSLRGGSGRKEVVNELLENIHRGKKSSILYRLFAPYFTREFPHVEGMKVLDVGCGSGHFMAEMKKRFDNDYYGVEPGKFDREFAARNGLKIFKGILKDAHYPSDYFDLILVNHVFEHVDDPSDTLRELKRILKPGGTLTIGVPNTDALNRRIFGKYWVGYEVPRHLYNYNPRILKKYAQKVGLKTKRLRFGLDWYYGLPLQLLFVLNATRKNRHQYYHKIRKKGSYKALLTPLNAAQCAFLIVMMPVAHVLTRLGWGETVEIFLTK